MTPILFFTDDITLNVHSASDKKLLGLSSIKDFIDEYGQEVRLYDLGNDEYEVQNKDSTKFMTGIVL